MSSDCYRTHTHTFIYRFSIEFHVASAHTAHTHSPRGRESINSIQLIDWINSCWFYCLRLVACMRHIKTVSSKQSMQPNSTHRKRHNIEFSYFYLDFVKIDMHMTTRHPAKSENLPTFGSLTNVHPNDWRSARRWITWSPTIMAFFEFSSNLRAWIVVCARRMGIPSRAPRPHHKKNRQVEVRVYVCSWRWRQRVHSKGEFNEELKRRLKEIN